MLRAMPRKRMVESPGEVRVIGDYLALMVATGTNYDMPALTTILANYNIRMILTSADGRKRSHDLMHAKQGPYLQTTRYPRELIIINEYKQTWYELD